jgi:hypothetical protein
MLTVIKAFERHELSRIKKMIRVAFPNNAKSSISLMDVDDPALIN